MTAANPFASDSRPSVSFKDAAPGTSFNLTVEAAPELVQARDFDTNQPAVWDDGNPKMTVVTKVADEHGQELSLWAPKPSALFAAISRSAPNGISVGGRLVVTMTGEKKNPEKPRLNAAKQYEVTYTPPNAFGGEAAAPASAAQVPAAPSPAAAPQQAKPSEVDTARQLIAAGLDDNVVQTTCPSLTTAVLAALRNESKAA